MNDYLFTGEDEADAETARLERLLSRYRHGGQAILPVRIPEKGQAGSPVLQPRWLAVAAAIVIAILLFVHQRNGIGWRATAAEATNIDSGSFVREGQLVRTGNGGRARLESRAVGAIDLAANTTVRILSDRRDRQSFELSVGTIHATTSSPPGVFVVETPRTKAIDLGCEYTLTVAGDGAGKLHVDSGWVELSRSYAQSLVPASASADFDRHGFMTMPYFDDADPALKDGVRKFTFSDDTNKRQQALANILSKARRRDALTLINLFPRATPEQRLAVFDRLNALVPTTIARDSVADWHVLVTEPWWPDVLKASGIGPIKKPRKMPY